MTAWGAESATIYLPMFQLTLEGMSPAQKAVVLDIYPGFLEPVPGSEGVTKAHCRAYRLDAPLPEPESAFSRDGSYAPRLSWEGQQLNCHGANFLASIDFGSSPARMELGVYAEGDLSELCVIENCLRYIAAHTALQQGGVVLHSAGLVQGESAYLFCGRSGRGKTTLSRKAADIGCKVLSDDLNLVLPQNESFAAFAVPFTGEFGRTLNQLGTGDHYPLAAIVLLAQGDALALETVSPSEALATLLVTSPFANEQEHEADALMDALLALLAQVPVYRLTSRREDDAQSIFGLLEAQAHKADLAEAS